MQVDDFLKKYMFENLPQPKQQMQQSKTEILKTISKMPEKQDETMTFEEGESRLVLKTQIQKQQDLLSEYEQRYDNLKSTKDDEILELQQQVNQLLEENNSLKQQLVNQLNITDRQGNYDNKRIAQLEQLNINLQKQIESLKAQQNVDEMINSMSNYSRKYQAIQQDELKKQSFGIDKNKDYKQVQKSLQLNLGIRVDSPQVIDQQLKQVKQDAQTVIQVIKELQNVLNCKTNVIVQKVKQLMQQQAINIQ